MPSLPGGAVLKGFYSVALVWWLGLGIWAKEKIKRGKLIDAWLPNGNQFNFHRWTGQPPESTPSTQQGCLEGPSGAEYALAEHTVTCFGSVTTQRQGSLSAPRHFERLVLCAYPRARGPGPVLATRGPPEAASPGAAGRRRAARSASSVCLDDLTGAVPAARRSFSRSGAPVQPCLVPAASLPPPLGPGRLLAAHKG